MQSQIPNPPYIGLWTRLASFRRDDLTTLIENYQIVRAAMMRSTLHLVTAEDHQLFRQTLQPALEKAHRSFNGKTITESLDNERLIAAAKPFLEAEPRSTGDLREHLQPLYPDIDGNTLAYAVRTYLPLIQVPPAGTWGSGTRATYIPAENVLGTPAPPDLRTLLHRYLAAYGPASVMDFQFWTGLSSLKTALKPLIAELVVYQDESGGELLDLPDAPLPDENTPAPVRFIPEYDNPPNGYFHCFHLLL
jgi:hypothetical protein